MSDQIAPNPVAAAAAEPPVEPRFPIERYLDRAPDFARELGRPVTRATVRGALHRLERELGSRMPKTLTRAAMLEAIVAYLDAEV